MTSTNRLTVRRIVVVLSIWGFLALDLSTIGAEQKLSVNSIDLVFSPVSVQPLKKAQPKKTWIRVKTIKIQSTPSHQASILLYVDPETNSVVETHAFLEDHGTHKGKSQSSDVLGDGEEPLLKPRDIVRRSDHTFPLQADMRK